MPELSERLSDSRLRPLVAFLLLAMAGTGILDLVQDGAKAWRGFHGLLEAAFILLSLGAAVFLWSGWQSERSSLLRIRQSLESHRADRDAWRSRAQGYLRGLGQAISDRFAAWNLTPAESETGLLLLKGLSHKEVAAATGRSERTVRQHAISLYRKAGLGGRAELSAYFLEDLLLPAEAGEAPPTIAESANPV